MYDPANTHTHSFSLIKFIFVSQLLNTMNEYDFIFILLFIFLFHPKMDIILLTPLCFMEKSKTFILFGQNKKLKSETSKIYNRCRHANIYHHHHIAIDAK